MLIELEKSITKMPCVKIIKKEKNEKSKKNKIPNKNK